MSKKTQLWLGILVGGGVAYYLYMNYKKTGKWFNAVGKEKGWYATAQDGTRVYCPESEKPCPVDLRIVSR